MDGQLTDFERQALEAYKWAEASKPNMFEDLLPRSYNKLVEAYCRANQVPVVPWNKGNSGRNLTTIITSLSKRGLRLNDRGHLTFHPANGAVGEAKGSKDGTAALPHAKSSVSSSKPPVAIQKSASASSVPKKSLLKKAEQNQVATTEPPLKKQATSPPPLSPKSSNLRDGKSQSRHPHTVTVQPAAKEVSAKLKALDSLHRRQEYEKQRREMVERLRESAQKSSAPEKAAQNVSAQQPPRPKPPHSPQAKSERNDSRHEEDEMMERAIRLSLEESEREKHIDEYIRAQLLSASSPSVFSPSNDQPHHHKPPMLTKRSSSGRIRASAHSVQKRSDDKCTPASNTAECPVCSVRLPLAEIDSHLDSCLSEKTVAELTSSNGIAGADGASKGPSKKRAASDDPSLLDGSPLAKKEVPPENEGDDCLIIDGPGPKSSYFYYSDPEDDGSDDDDDDDMDDDLWFSRRDTSSDQEGPKPPHDHLAYQRYLQSRMFAEKLGLGSSTKSPNIAPSSKPTHSSHTHHPTPLSPTPPPQKPKLSIPNSGGLFSEVEFKTDQPDKECPICFEEFLKGDVGVMLPCLCLYHPKCISSWLERKPKNCPSHGDF